MTGFFYIRVQNIFKNPLLFKLLVLKETLSLLRIISKPMVFLI